MATFPRRQNMFAQLKRAIANPMAYCLKANFTAADINAGTTIIPARAYGGVRLYDVTLVALGGAAGGATSINITGTQAGTVISLVSAPVAVLTQNAVVRITTATVVVPAGSAFFKACDNGAPIQIGKVGASVTGLTSLDVILLYAIDQ
jgi:hypothetical protein